MNKINDFLDKRLKSTKKSSPKMELLAQQSASGNLSSFSGIFTTQELSEAERTHLQQLLEKYDHPTNTHLSSDLNNLSQITSEIKAINTQAIILHGERIQQVQKILKKYQEGAFTAWLITTYGNRQTPYNFLQYYELYTSMPKNLHPKIESMPKQAIYSLASRTASTHKKRSFIEKCQKQNKQEILQLIRDQFPLAEYDKRQPNHYNTLVNLLNRVHLTLNQKKHTLTQKNKQTLQNLLNQIQQTVKK